MRFSNITDNWASAFRFFDSSRVCEYLNWVKPEQIFGAGFKPESSFWLRVKPGPVRGDRLFFSLFSFSFSEKSVKYSLK